MNESLHHRFRARLPLGRCFSAPSSSCRIWRSIHELKGTSATETLFRTLQERGVLRTDVSVSGPLPGVRRTSQLGLTALWAVEGPPFLGDGVRTPTARFRRSVKDYRWNRDDARADDFRHHSSHRLARCAGGSPAQRVVPAPPTSRVSAFSTLDEGREQRKQVSGPHYRDDEAAERQPVRRGIRVVGTRGERLARRSPALASG